MITILHMRTTINLSEELLEHVMQETGAKTVTQAIRDALREYLEHRKRQRLIASFGRYADWDPDVRGMRRDRDLG